MVRVEVDDRAAPAEEDGTGPVDVGVPTAQCGGGGCGRGGRRRWGQLGDGTDEVGQELDVLRGELGLEPHLVCIVIVVVWWLFAMLQCWRWPTTDRDLRDLDYADGAALSAPAVVSS